MRLYLIRHAKAEQHAPGGDDAARALTERGRSQASWLSARLAREVDAPARVLTSPARRAVQTAEALSRPLRVDAEREESLGLDAHPSDVIELIATLAGGPPVALVGHNPTFSLAAAILLNGVAGDRSPDLRTGEAAVLEIPDSGAAPGTAKLVGMLRMPR